MSDSSTISSPLSRRGLLWICGGILVISCGLRVGGIFNAFWIDEIISWDIARAVQSPFQIFTSVHHDNNHHLSTLWMYLLGDGQPWPMYRLLAVVTGTASVALAGWIALKDGSAAAIFAMLLCGGSYFLVQYSSEARGYAPAMMFALACTALLLAYLADRRRKYSLAFAACAILGICSHLTFAYIYLALVVWSIAQLSSSQRKYSDLLRLHGLPLVFCAGLYLIDIRSMTVAAGPVYPRWRVIADTAAWMIGIPRSGAWPCVALIFAAGIVAGGLIASGRARERLLYASAIVFAPALMLLLWRQPFLYPRYFLIVAPFFYLLLARMLAIGWKRNRAARVICATIVLLFLVVNAARLVSFYHTGRGHYLEAMRYMAEQRGGSATVGAMQDPRNRLMVDFYRRYLPAGEAVTYIDDAAATTNPPQWLIVDAVEWNEPKMDARILPNGARYTFDRKFEYYGLSGIEWYLFRRE